MVACKILEEVKEDFKMPHFDFANSRYIQIGAFQWEIVFIPNDQQDLEQDMGECDYEKLQIRITDGPEINPQIVADSILHEVLHAIIYSTPYHNTLSITDEETFVQILTPFLLQAIQQLQKELAFPLENI